jgi:hypothetical protein
VREEGEKFEPYYSFVALSSKMLKGEDTDGRKLQDTYLYNDESVAMSWEL